MDRLNQLRGAAGASGDSTLDTTSPPSEAYMTANESSSKYFSLSEDDSTFDISSIKDVSLASTTADTESANTGADELISNLSPVGKKSEMLDSYRIGKQIEAANILSGGVDIFDDNDNSYDGDELVIDDNAEIDEKSNLESKLDHVVKPDNNLTESTLIDTETDIASKDPEVVLQIDGKNVDAIDIGNGIYLYRKEGQEELAAVQIIDDDQQQQSFKFLKVRENAEGNLEVYEEIEIEVPKEVPAKEGKTDDKNTSHVPIKDINKVITDNASNKVAERKNKMPQKETAISTSSNEAESEVKDALSEPKTEVNLNGKMMKFNESRKSPVIGTFTPMTYHSTPHKEGIPLTKTMVDLQLHPSRHSDNVKKTIEVHTDSCKQKLMETQTRNKDLLEDKETEVTLIDKAEKPIIVEEKSEEPLKSNKTIIDEGKEDSVKKIENTENDSCSPDKRSDVSEDKSDERVTKIDNHASESPGTSVPANVAESNRQNDNQVLSEISGEKNKDTSKVSLETSKQDSSTLKELERLSVPIVDRKCLNENKETKEATNIATEIKTVDNIKVKNPEETTQKDIVATTSTDETKKIIQTCQDIETVSVEPKKGSHGSTERNITEKHVEASNNQPNIEEKFQIDDKSSKNRIAACDKISSLIGNKSDTNAHQEIKSKPDTGLLELTTRNIKISDKEITFKDDKSEKILKAKAVPKIEQHKSNRVKEGTSTEKVIEKILKTKTEPKDNKKDIPKVSANIEPKPIHNNHAAVPFGKWTEANRQEFLNKIKETKVHVNSSNGKQIKNSNDLNRRDVLQKIDSQRQSNNSASKAQDLNKINVKNETVFSNKPQDRKIPNAAIQESKIPVKLENSEIKNKPTASKKITKQELVCITQTEPQNITSAITNINKKENADRKEVNAQDLIDKTIEGMINRVFAGKSISEETKQTSPKDTNIPQKSAESHASSATGLPTTLDAIEMKMNELHGIPFIERPPHELPHVNNPALPYTTQEKEKPCENKMTKIPNLLSFTNKTSKNFAKDNVVELDSEDEIIEHEPITGDLELKKKDMTSKLNRKETSLVEIDTTKLNTDATKIETIITEKDFDKFVRRNSVTYENRLTVNFDGKESHTAHNVIQTVVEKDVVLKNYPKSEVLRMDSKTKLLCNQQSTQHNIQSNKIQSTYKSESNIEDPSNKNYQSKVQIAYQSALTAKRQLECPITIIEDKPVKVVYMDVNPEFTSCRLNVQGQELSPAKKQFEDTMTISNCDSLDSDMMDAVDDGKSQDETKTKTKHQRKQILTPVEAPELELIEPKDLGIDVSPKKKRKTEDSKCDKISKNLVHKKSYLLGRNIGAEGKVTYPQDVAKNPLKETINRNDDIVPKDTISALDNLVKAAELLENQSENMNSSNNINPDSQQNTPVKRGRGRPRKYPLPDGTTNMAKVPSPQKKPRLIDAKPNKRDTITEEEDSSDEEIVKENWTMGKINENILCPICNKLFRSENVVFKHVKHCTGPSPNRSDTDKRSPRRYRQSQESDSKSRDSRSDQMEVDQEKVSSNESKKETPKKRKSKDSLTTTKSEKDKDVIVIVDTPLKEKLEKVNAEIQHESRKAAKTKIQNRMVNNLVCEFCGKTFRQLSYLASHKLQHKKEDSTKIEKDTQNTSKSVFSCDVCKKEFRKLHHLVQHRIIHNPNTMPSRLLRKSSSEQHNGKTEKEETSKHSEDTSAGFRCEPCDKSFRKLHHLVEHRETHDGINRQKTTSTAQAVAEKSTPPPQCEICKKTFRKLHHLIEHKEQHAETSSEKSDDKSVKSSLSTKDIIHECSLCYMVFPNEHSLNKHTVICQRKKRQSKQPKLADENDSVEGAENPKQEENKIEDNDEPELVPEEIPIINLEKDDVNKKSEVSVTEKVEDVAEIVETPSEKHIEEKPIVPQALEIVKIDIEKDNLKDTETVPEVLEKVEKVVDKEIVKIHDTPKKKIPLKDKVAPTVTKRQKAPNLQLPVVKEDKSAVESSDDDEVRYMFNPDFKIGDTSEGKLFMKVQAKKRSSLQIERPNSKELIKRRTSLQHPPKIPRLKPKPIETISTKTAPLKNLPKTPKLEPVPFNSDSDDSDVKYSFPKTAVDKSPKIAQERTRKEVAKRTQRKSLSEKRKSLSAIAKRKSLGKTVTALNKSKASPAKQVKKRTTEVEHRCDCGQLFSSAALLSRHTSLAHTPPRIRKRRSPPPDIETTTLAKPASRKSTEKSKQTGNSRKSSVRSDTGSAHPKPSAPPRKSIKGDGKPSDARKSIKAYDKVVPAKSTSADKPRRYAAHRGVPVPEKMRKMMQKASKI